MSVLGGDFVSTKQSLNSVINIEEIKMPIICFMLAYTVKLSKCLMVLL